jgi:hypothetical protein
MHRVGRTERHVGAALVKQRERAAIARLERLKRVVRPSEQILANPQPHR